MCMKVLVIFLITVNSICGQDEVYVRGGYSGGDVYLPCIPYDEEFPQVPVRAVWWQTGGLSIGSYTRFRGFQPSDHPQFQGKYNMSSLMGMLRVYDLDRTEDHDQNYTCGIVFFDGTNYTYTKTVNLQIGYKPHGFYINANGERSDDWKQCLQHDGYDPVTCSVVSDPPSSVTWTVRDDDNCNDMLDNITNKCEAWDETQYNCSSSISVRPECYGHLKCRVSYVYRTDRVDDCLYINYIYLPVPEEPERSPCDLCIGLLIMFICIITGIIIGLICCIGISCGIGFACKQCGVCSACNKCHQRNNRKTVSPEPQALEKGGDKAEGPHSYVTTVTDGESPPPYKM